MDGLDIANHDTVHKTPGVTAERLADLAGIGYQLLINKVNWAVDRNKLTQREAISLQLITDTRQIIRAECRILGGEFVPDAAGHVLDIPTAVLAAVAEHGDVARAINDSLSDGKLCAREEAHINYQIDEAIQALNALRATVLVRSAGQGTVTDFITRK